MTTIERLRELSNDMSGWRENKPPCGCASCEVRRAFPYLLDVVEAAKELAPAALLLSADADCNQKFSSYEGLAPWNSSVVTKRMATFLLAKLAKLEGKP